MFEKAVMSGTKALGFVPGEDWTTEIRLVAWSLVSAAAEEIEGNNIDTPNAKTARFFMARF